jgi:hypothetical protein
MELFYIRAHGYCGNCLTFWAIEGLGYTCDLAQAWKVTKEQGLKLCRPKEDFLYPVAEVDAVAVKHVNPESLMFKEIQPVTE